MHALVHLRINQQTKFEVPSFTISKDMIGAEINKRVTWPWPPFYGCSVILKLGYDIFYCKQNFAALEISLGRKI